MKRSDKFYWADWIWPVAIGLVSTVIALLLADFSSDSKCLMGFANEFVPLIFTYATTMLGLSLACYTLFQALDNDMVRVIRKWKVYTRFKYYIWHIMILLAILAVFSLIEIYAFGALLELVTHWILLGIPMFLTILSLVALVYWIGLLIRYFDAERERKTKPEQ